MLFLTPVNSHEDDRQLDLNQELESIRCKPKDSAVCTNMYNTDSDNICSYKLVGNVHTLRIAIFVYKVES